MTARCRRSPRGLIESTLDPNLTLVIVVGGLVAAGTVLVLDRSLVRILLGMVLIGNGVAVLFLVVCGPAGRRRSSARTRPR